MLQMHNLGREMVMENQETVMENEFAMSQRQVTHGTGKTGKTGNMAKKKSLSGKTQGSWKFCQNTGKTQGILFAQVVNSLILKVWDIAIFAAEISIFFPRSWIGLPSHFCICNSYKLCKLAQGKFAVGQGKHREFENTI